jgi:hypothetical protein
MKRSLVRVLLEAVRANATVSLDVALGKSERIGGAVGVAVSVDPRFLTLSDVDVYGAVQRVPLDRVLGARIVPSRVRQLPRTPPIDPDALAWEVDE